MQGLPLEEEGFYTHEDGFPLFFTSSYDYSEGLELLAEDGIPDELFNSLLKKRNVKRAGYFPQFPPVIV